MRRRPNAPAEEKLTHPNPTRDRLQGLHSHPLHSSASLADEEFEVLLHGGDHDLDSNAASDLTNGAKPGIAGQLPENNLLSITVVSSERRVSKDNNSGGRGSGGQGRAPGAASPPMHHTSGQTKVWDSAGQRSAGGAASSSEGGSGIESGRPVRPYEADRQAQATLYSQEGRSVSVPAFTSIPSDGSLRGIIRATSPYTLGLMATGCSLALLSQHMANKGMIMNQAQLPAWTRCGRVCGKGRAKCVGAAGAWVDESVQGIQHFNSCLDKAR